MRLIDADALMREFAYFVKASNNSDFADVPTWNDAVSLLGSAPTIETEPIVRCKNCKHHKDEEVGMVYCPNIVGGWVEEEGYCSWCEVEE